MSSRSELDVAIIGGGPGGLTLARILHCQGMKSVTVYEKEESRSVRGQGGSLDLHKNTGQYALKLAKLTEEFQEHSRNEGQDMRVLDKHGVVHYEEVAKDDRNDRPEIDRSKLRDILLNSLPDNCVKWGYTLKDLEEKENGKIKLIFQNGETSEADFVVGADGAWSKVRPFLSKESPTYSGISFIEITLNDVDEKPELSKLVGRGMMLALDKDKGIIAQRNSGGVVKVYLALRVPEDWLKTVSADLDFKDLEKAKQFVLNLFEGWDESILKLIHENNGEFVQRLIHALPIGHSWKRKPEDTLASRITLIGDAAHVMSPFAGEGVNLAMMDAAGLAMALKSFSKNTLNKFESEMFSRAEAAAKESSDNLEMMFGPQGVAGIVNLMNQYNSWHFLVKYTLKLAYGAIITTLYSWIGWK